MSPMEKFAAALDDLLSKLPGNGSKTVVGAGLNILLPLLLAKFPMLLMLQPALSGVSLAITGLGMLHKAVKAFRASLKK